MIFIKQTTPAARGLTLAELLVAIGIIALAAAVSVPFYRVVSLNLNLNAASRDLASDLRYAQQLAVTTQINHRVVFDAAENSYSIKNSSSGETVKSRAIKDPIIISSISGLADNTVTFNATGAVTSTGSITLANPNNREAVIEIKPSGYVKIQ